MTEVLPARINAAERELALVETPEDTKALYDKLETLSQYAKRYGAEHEKQNEIARVKLRTVRKGGELLAETLQWGGARSRGGTLPEGFTKNMSSRWQAVARMSDEAFTEILTRVQQEITLQAALNRAGRGERDRRIKAEREESRRRARAFLAEAGADACKIEIGDIKTWRPSDAVSCIIADPPYITKDAVKLHSALADLAVDILPTHGALAVMTWQPLLPAVFEAMKRDRLIYRWTAAWTFATSERTPEHKPRVFDGWKPILVFHKDGWSEESTYLYDVIVSRDSDKESHEWGQSLNGFRQLVRAFAKPGERVCDPFVGGGTTALAALAETCMFVGCDVDEDAVRVAEERLAA